MKKYIFLLLCCFSITLVNAQLGCSVPHFATISPTYTPVGGLGVEIGQTGMDSPWNFHAGTVLFLNNVRNKVTQEPEHQGRIYGKVGYRVFREDYVISVFTNVMGGLDLQRGYYSAASLKLLHPMGLKAISVEPFYIIYPSPELNVQFAIHFML